MGLIEFVGIPRRYRLEKEQKPYQKTELPTLVFSVNQKRRNSGKAGTSLCPNLEKSESEHKSLFTCSSLLPSTPNTGSGYLIGASYRRAGCRLRHPVALSHVQAFLSMGFDKGVGGLIWLSGRLETRARAETLKKLKETTGGEFRVYRASIRLL